MKLSASGSGDDMSLAVAMIARKSRGRMSLPEKRAILFKWSDELLELNCDSEGKIQVFYRAKYFNKCGKKFPCLSYSSCSKTFHKCGKKSFLVYQVLHAMNMYALHSCYWGPSINDVVNISLISVSPTAFCTDLQYKFRLT